MLHVREPRRQQCFECRGLGGRQEIQEASLVVHVVGECSVDEFQSGAGESDDPAPLVVVGPAAGDESGALQAIDSFRHRAGGDHGVRGEFARCPFIRLARAPQGAQDVEFPLAQAVAAVDEAEFFAEAVCKTVQSADHSLWRGVDVGSFAAPLVLDAGYTVHRVSVFHDFHISFPRSYIVFHGS